VPLQISAELCETVPEHGDVLKAVCNAGAPEVDAARDRHGMGLARGGLKQHVVQRKIAVGHDAVVGDRQQARHQCPDLVCSHAGVRIAKVVHVHQACVQPCACLHQPALVVGVEGAGVGRDGVDVAQAVGQRVDHRRLRRKLTGACNEQLVRRASRQGLGQEPGLVVHGSRGSRWREDQLHDRGDGQPAHQPAQAHRLVDHVGGHRAAAVLEIQVAGAAVCVSVGWPRGVRGWCAMVQPVNHCARLAHDVSRPKTPLHQWRQACRQVRSLGRAFALRMVEHRARLQVTG